MAVRRAATRSSRRALAGLSRYIATVETAKHRVFAFLDRRRSARTTCSIAIAHRRRRACSACCPVSAACRLGAGGRRHARRIGPRYNKTRCFEPFPFPAATDRRSTARIRELAEQLDAHRKRQQARAPRPHPDRPVQRAGEAARPARRSTAKDKAHPRAGAGGGAEEPARRTRPRGARRLRLERPRAAAGSGQRQRPPRVRRPARPRRGAARAGRCAAGAAGGAQRRARRRGSPRPGALAAPGIPEPAGGAAPGRSSKWKAKPTAAALTPALSQRAREKLPWPDTLPEQVATVARLLAESPLPLDADAIAARHTGRGPWKKRLPQLLETLVALGRARWRSRRLRAAGCRIYSLAPLAQHASAKGDQAAPVRRSIVTPRAGRSLGAAGRRCRRSPQAQQSEPTSGRPMPAPDSIREPAPGPRP
ncbi:MAG: hypothetical protein MZW92_03700 [Comamonadaceae bacterium]|nr:hypothetical protein [Comamonadaceae bacterium]